MSDQTIAGIDPVRQSDGVNRGVLTNYIETVVRKNRIDGRPIRALLVEDNPGDSRLIQEMLMGAGDALLDVETATQLTTGLDRLAASGIDVILLDLSLPDSWGFDTFTRVHTQAPKVPIIILTGFDDESLAIKAVREGAQDYLVKGQINGDLLVRSIRYAIQRKRMEEELIKMQKLESFGVLASCVAHDFNNILTAILGNLSLASMSVEAGEPASKVLDRLVAIEEASIKAKNLLQRLLAFSRDAAPVKKTTSIAESLRGSITFALSGESVKCEFFIPDNLWPVEIDEGQVGQVFNNLIINASQAMPSGGTVKIYAGNMDVRASSGLLLPPGQYVRISVEDEGGGIPEESLQKIFDPYFTANQEGDGIELATSYSIIRSHNGHITVESQPGIGTTFHVYLPALPQILLKKEKAEETSTKYDNSDVCGGRILVMDDEDTIRDITSKILDSIGYEVEVASEGGEAVELYRKAKESGQPFTAVIMDLTVPGGMGGDEVIQKLVEIDPGVKAIAFSDYLNDPITDDFRKHGFSGFVTKPYEIRQLRETLHKVIAS